MGGQSVCGAVSLCHRKRAEWSGLSHLEPSGEASLLLLLLLLLLHLVVSQQLLLLLVVGPGLLAGVPLHRLLVQHLARPSPIPFLPQVQVPRLQPQKSRRSYAETPSRCFTGPSQQPAADTGGDSSTQASDACR